MAIIQLKNGEADRYRAWLDFYASFGEVTFMQRTNAFFNARAGRWPY